MDKGSDGKKDLQTEADRAAQFCIEQSLQKKFDNKLKIIGEEDITSAVPNVELGVSVDVLSLDSKCSAELRSASLEDLVIWVDPLDGTSEFAEAAKIRSRKSERRSSCNQYDLSYSSSCSSNCSNWNCVQRTFCCWSHSSAILG